MGEVLPPRDPLENSGGGFGVRDDWRLGLAFSRQAPGTLAFAGGRG